MEKLVLEDLSHIILSSLCNFNTQPDYINKIIDRLEVLDDHHIQNHLDIYQKAVEYYDKHDKYPDVKYLSEVTSKYMKDLPDSAYSVSIYEDLIRRLDEEILRSSLNKKIVRADELDKEAIQESIKSLQQHLNRNNIEKISTRKDIVDGFRDYLENFDGVTTGIPIIDESLGVLGYKSLAVVGAPSGHGKTTLAISIAVNNALMGKHVTYVTFEVNKTHMWFNIASNASFSQAENDEELIVATDLKQPKCRDLNNPEVISKLKKHDKVINNFLTDCKVAGGYINILDLTTISFKSLEELTAYLEADAEKTGRKTDLIIIDNVDGLKRFKSYEREESVKVNNMIIGLDEFSKTYRNGEGTTVLLLSQLNREGIFNLGASEKASGDDSAKKPKSISYTVFSKFNALYERATVALVAFSDNKMRSMNRMRIYPVKTRDNGFESDYIDVSAHHAYSRIGGSELITANESMDSAIYTEELGDSLIED